MRRITILFLVVAASGVMAGQYLATFAQVRSEVKNSLNITGTTYVTDSTLNGFIREGIVTVNPILRGVKATSAFVTSVRQNTYNLDSLTIGIMSVEWAKGDSVKTLTYMPRHLWYERLTKTVFQEIEYAARPSYYDYTDNQIFLYPTPIISGDTIKVLGFKRITGIDTLTTLSAMPEAYRAAVYKYVLWRVAASKQHPMTQVYYGEYVAARDLIALAFRGVVNAPAN